MNFQVVTQMMNAAKDGDLETIERLSHENPSLMTLHISDLAMQHGHLNIIRFCVENGFPLDKEAIAAATFGHLDILQFIYQRFKHVQFSNKTMESAAGGDQVHVLQYLSKLSIDYDKEDLKRAAKRTNAKRVLKWLETLE